MAEPSIKNCSSNCFEFVMRVWRVHLPEQKLCPHGVLSVCLFLFTVGTPSRSLVKKSAPPQFSCPPCDCHCSSAEYLLDPLVLSYSDSGVATSAAICRGTGFCTLEEPKKIGALGFWEIQDSAMAQFLVNSSLAFLLVESVDCGKHDPVLNEEMNKGLLAMLSEELNLQKVVAKESLEHTKRLVMDARKTFSQYQKEAEKCNIGMETCEEARQRAEAELIEERRLTTMWENRAREYGWSDRKNHH
ncbi:hypothetical protein V8G54_034025 [Vigna mungo]|uniref:Uncharacterized protein n=1 Tax=Vigna mungo TaxID=3915 RepID=A0AAQ3MPG3_VIGMU